MTYFFISDLHLAETEPEITTLFDHFMDQIAPRGSRLYVLGDLFDAWVGDDYHSPLVEHITCQFKKAAKHCSIHFVHGNRDFLLGQRFCESAGGTLLPEKSFVEFHGEKALILHGDQLCTDDTAYMAFRKQTRDPAWQKQILALSIEDRIKKAQEYRLASKGSYNQISEDIMDVNDNEVVDTLENAQSRLMIHGHTHRPAIHTIDHPSLSYERVVLSDWSPTKGNFLCWDENGRKLVYFDTQGIL